MTDKAKDVSQELEAIRGVYKKNLPEKFSNFEKLLQKIAEEPDNSEIIGELLTAVHKFHGSAGSYGFDNVSKIAGEWEQMLQTIHADGTTLEESQIGKMRDYLKDIKKAGGKL